MLSCFLVDGRHSQEDVPRLCAEAARAAWRQRARRAGASGAHALLAQLLLERAGLGVSASAPWGAYLDWNATAPPRPEATQAYLRALAEDWGNPASVHRWGQRARHALDQAKLRMAEALGCAAHELVLTSGGTEANATAIAAFARGDGAAGTTAHARPAAAPCSPARSSTARCCGPPRSACRRLGAQLVVIPVDDCGRIDLGALAAALAPSTRLVCLQLANNEVGTIQDLAPLVAAARARAPQARILADCCQTVGRMALPPLPSLGVDAVSIAGHKLGAPKGTGVLWLRGGSLAEPLLHGGRQQQDRRSGTEDARGCRSRFRGRHLAATTCASRGGDRALPRPSLLIQRLWERIASALPAAVWIAQGAPRLANTCALAHPGCRRDALVARLDLDGVGVSPGAACMAARGEPSHVVAALGLPPELARSALRVSIGWATTEAEIDAGASAYIAAVRALSVVPEHRCTTSSTTSGEDAVKAIERRTPGPGPALR